MLYPLAKLTCLSLGLYCSFKAVRSRNKERGMQWLTFWIVMAFYRAAEFVADLFLSWWLPFYGYFKLFAILFVLFTQPWGSDAVYKQHLRPLFRSNQFRVEDFQRNYGSYIMNLSKAVVSISLTLTSLLFSIDAAKGVPISNTPLKEQELKKEVTETKIKPKTDPVLSRGTKTRLNSAKSFHGLRTAPKVTPNTRSVADIRSKFQQEEKERFPLSGRRVNHDKPITT